MRSYTGKERTGRDDSSLCVSPCRSSAPATPARSQDYVRSSGPLPDSTGYWALLFMLVGLLRCPWAACGVHVIFELLWGMSLTPRSRGSQLFQKFVANPNGIFLGPFVNKSVAALPVGSLGPAPVYPIPTGLKK